MNIFNLEVIDAIAQGWPGYTESVLEGVFLEIRVDDKNERRVYNEFLEGILPEKFKICDYSHIVLKVRNDDTEFGLRKIDDYIWVAKRAIIKHR